MEDLLEIIEEIQANTGNRVPEVALYMAIVARMPVRTDVRSLINEAVEENRLIWGKTPHTYWFATQLSDEDRERIKESKGWTIEQYY